MVITTALNPSPPLPLILSPPLHVSSPPPASLIRSLGYRAAMIRLSTPSSGTPLLLPILLPTSSPPLLLLSIDRRATDTNEIYTRLDDEQSERQLMAGRLNMLYRDRRAHARTARLMETEARMSREAWG
ncbi:hypothetical protein Tco_1292890 [Tanacetum coccineum]